MRISVVVPCFNAAPWVAQALQSVAAQTRAPCEIIVVDDGSTDDSVERIGNSGVSVRLLHTERANGAGARNAGIKAATGEWIAFQDADDVWNPNHLERAQTLLRDTQDIGYLCHSDALIPSGAAVALPHFGRFHLPATGLSSQEYGVWFAEAGYFIMPASIVRRDVLLEIGGLDPAQIRRHDIDLWLRALPGHTWSYDPVSSLAFRSQRPGSLTRDIASCEYFLLRALLKNQKNYPGMEMTKRIRTAARLAVTLAFMDSPAAERKTTLNLAWPHLATREKMVFGCFKGCPAIFRGLNRLRRRLLGIPSHQTLDPLHGAKIKGT